MKHQLSRSDGFGLLEIIIAGAILGGLGLVLTEFARIQQKIVATSEAGFETLQLQSEIADTLRSPQSCVETFKNVTIVPGASPGAEVSSITRSYLDNAGNTVNTVAIKTVPPGTATTNPPPTVVVESMNVITKNPFDGSASLSVRITRNKMGVMGGTTVTRLITLTNVVLDATNKITSCAAAGVTTPAQTCAGLGGAWDAVANKCGFPTPTVSGVPTAGVITGISGGGITQYGNGVPGTKICESDAGWTRDGTVTITNATSVAKNFLVVGAASVSNDGGWDNFNYLLKWNTGATDGGYIHTNEVAFDHKNVADVVENAKARNGLMGATSVETLSPGETRTYSQWVSITGGGCGKLMGGKITATPL